MLLAVFRKFIVLFFCGLCCCFSQSIGNVDVFEFSQTSFSIERPFTISVKVTNSETRPAVTFPDIPGFSKKGMLTTVTAPDISEKNGGNQIITQNYQARAAGRFVLPPFTITVNGEVLRSKGIVLVVRPSAMATVAANTTLTRSVLSPNGAAFLTLSASKPVVYTRQVV